MHRTAVRLLAIAALLASPVASSAQEPPRWFLDEIRLLGATDSPWWQADNAPYRSADETFVAYATRWRPADNGRTLSGELVAIDSTGRRLPMWTYRMYWHPGERQGFLMQTSSWGAYGIGAIARDTTGSSVVLVNDQDFWQPDGSTFRVRHRSWWEGDTVHVTESLQWRDGAWQPNRTYRWRRTENGER